MPEDAPLTGATLTGATPPEGTPPPQDPAPPNNPPTPPADPEPPKAKTLDELLAGMDDEQRRIVKGEVDKARNEAKNLRERVKTAEPKAAEHDKALEAQKTAEQRAQDAATAAEKRATTLLTRAVRGEVKALAAEKFADPDDPAGFLNLTRYANDDGEIDTAAITADLDELLTRKPHLGKADPKPRPPAPNKAQGSSGNGAPEPNIAPGMARLRQAYSTTK